MLRKIFAFSVLVLVVILGIAYGTGFVGAAGPDEIRGEHWLGYHKAGDLYEFNLDIGRNLRHSTTMALKVYGLDLSTAQCVTNDWPVTVSVSGTMPDYTFTVTPTLDANPDYIGFSANLRCGLVPVTPDYEGFTKIGVYPVVPLTTSTVGFSANLQTMFDMPGGETTVRISDGTEFELKDITADTKVEVLIGSNYYPLATCDGVTTCSVKAPEGMMFDEFGTAWSYVHLRFSAATGKTPTIVGITNPAAPTPTPTAAPAATPTP